MAQFGQPRQFTTGPQIPLRSLWSTNLITLTMFVALLPVLGLVLYRHGANWLSVLLVCVIVTLFWQALFARIRRQSLPIDGAVTALAFALVLPPSIAIWQVALSLSFGVIAGQEIFGGWGRNFLNPAVVALAFLIFSFPNTALDQWDGIFAIAALPGAILLIVTGLASWRIIIGAVAAMIVSGFIAGLADPLSGLLTGGFVFGLVFFVCDPVASASTNPGRWLYAVLFGALSVLLVGKATEITLDSVIFAALLSSILAPLIDQGMVWSNVYRRRHRHG